LNCRDKRSNRSSTQSPQSPKASNMLKYSLDELFNSGSVHLSQASQTQKSVVSPQTEHGRKDSTLAYQNEGSYNKDDKKNLCQNEGCDDENENDEDYTKIKTTCQNKDDDDEKENDKDDSLLQKNASRPKKLKILDSDDEENPIDKSKKRKVELSDDEDGPKDDPKNDSTSIQINPNSSVNDTTTMQINLNSSVNDATPNSSRQKKRTIDVVNDLIAKHDSSKRKKYENVTLYLLLNDQHFKFGCSKFIEKQIIYRYNTYIPIYYYRIYKFKVSFYY
jgi:hypothetical protein